MYCSCIALPPHWECKAAQNTLRWVVLVPNTCSTVLMAVLVLQKIEAPVRNDDSADRSYAYGGKPIGDRQNDVDRLLVDRDEPEEKRFLGTEVAFPDAMRFKGAAPEIANSRYKNLLGNPRLFNGGTPVCGIHETPVSGSVQSNAILQSL